MNLYKKNITFFFLASLAFTLFFPVLFPSFKVQFFVPFIILLFYRKSLIFCLWAAMGCGLILDLLSPHDRIGLYALNYTLTAGFLYSERRHFFADSLTTLPLMTGIFSILSTVIQAVLFSFFQKTIVISWGWTIKDLLIMPVIDMLFAFFVFILPFALFGKPIKKGKDYFMQEDP